MTQEFEGLVFSPLTKSDIPLLTPIMKRAFDEDSRLFFDKPEGGPDGYDDGSFLQKFGIDSHAVAYRIDYEGKPVGAIIVFIQPSGVEGFLGNLFIDPDYGSKGLGSRAWRFIEHSFPEVKAWSTQTPAVSYRNHRFYINKCGFNVISVEGDMDRYEAQFNLRKEMNKRKA